MIQLYKLYIILNNIIGISGVVYYSILLFYSSGRNQYLTIGTVIYVNSY